jgi:large subunit ribosomal protein L13
MLRKEDVSREWYHVDATGKVLGRLASEIAQKLIGKHKPNYTFHTDNGDFVVVTNANALSVTGKKLKNKIYYRHSGKPGNLKSTALRDLLEKHPTRALELAVRRMLPKNRIGRDMLGRLRLSENDTHNHLAQKPKELEI